MDYLDRSYFNVLRTKVKTVIDKTGSSPWYEPPLYNKGYALTTEEVNDNFQVLTAGELNLNARTKIIEDAIVDSAQNVTGGSVKYNGFIEKLGCFYGGKPFDLLASVDMPADPINMASPSDTVFYISEGNSLDYIVEGEINDATTKWYTVTVDFSGTKANLVTYLNQALVNNRLPYYIEGVDLSSPGTRLKWGDSNKTFSISFNDEDYQVITLNTNCNDTSSAASHIQNQILAKFPQYAGTFTVTSVSSKIRLTANSGVTGNRLTRVRVKEDAGMTVMGSTAGIGWITSGTEKAIFDFSNSLEFYLSGNKMGLRGKGSYSYFAIKDHTSKKTFTNFKLDNSLRSVAPFFQIAHTPYPTTAYTLPLSYAGILYVSGIVSAGNITGPINATTATIGTLTVTTLNASSVNIAGADITLSRVIGKGLYIKPNASSVDTNKYNALDGGIYVEGTATLTSAVITTGTIATLTVSGSTTLAATTIDSLTATTASITTLTVTGGSLNVGSVTATTVATTNVSATNATITNFILNNTVKTAGRLYTIALNTAVSTAPPTSTNSAAVSLCYDGYFAATIVYASSTQLTSARKLKKDITPYTDSALDIINKTDIVNFRYKIDDSVPHVGFIADDTHELLATPNHDTMEVGNNIGLLLKAVQELSVENKDLRRRLEVLETN